MINKSNYLDRGPMLLNLSVSCRYSHSFKLSCPVIHPHVILYLNWKNMLVLIELSHPFQLAKFDFDYVVLCRYKDKERDATMSILDIGLLTGFTANTDDLNLVRALTNAGLPTCGSKVKK